MLSYYYPETEKVGDRIGFEPGLAERLEIHLRESIVFPISEQAQRFLLCASQSDMNPSLRKVFLNSL
jgi:hypothetical protein